VCNNLGTPTELVSTEAKCALCAFSSPSPRRGNQKRTTTVPFYRCNVPAGSLTDDQKHDLAQNITRIHAEVTGAPPALVHVIYHELAAADSYTAGEPSSDIIISGHIRAGRSDADKQRLLREVAAASAAITRRPLDTIAVFIRDVPAKYILERGEIAPELGEEDAWLASRERSGAARLANSPSPLGGRGGRGRTIIGRARGALAASRREVPGDERQPQP
jgi:phenylpyruvate tautomerase PptA (4-oxalocrotonate tautomerase family)